MVWKGFPAVRRHHERRSEQIAGDLDDADKAKADAQAVKVQYEAELADAKPSRLGSSKRPVNRPKRVRTELQARAESDIADMRAQAAADVETARSRALDDLQAEVSDIVVGAAERVVEANLDRDAQAQ